MKRNSIKMQIYSLLWNNKERGITTDEFMSLILTTKWHIYDEIRLLRELGVEIVNVKNRYYMV